VCGREHILRACFTPIALSSPNIRNSPWNSADTLTFLAQTYWVHFLHRGVNPSELGTTHDTGFAPDSNPRNQTIHTLHTTPHGERVETSPKSTIKQRVPAFPPTTVPSIMVTPHWQHIGSDGSLPTQPSKLEDATTQGPEKIITMTISMGTGVTTVPVDCQGSNLQGKSHSSGHISVWNCIFANIFTWILLAGFLVLPSSFSKLESIEINSGEFKKVLQAIRNLPLLVVAYGCCAFGGTGMCFLWWRQRRHHFWLVHNLFFPGALHGLSGLLSTFVNVYATPDASVLGVSSIATLVVTGACTVICGFLALFHQLSLLRRAK